MNKSLNLPSLKSPWNCAQIGLFVLPLSPLLGAVFVILAVLKSWRQNFKDICRIPLYRGFAILGIWLIFICFLADNQTLSFLGFFNFFPLFIVFVGLSFFAQNNGTIAADCLDFGDRFCADCFNWFRAVIFGLEGAGNCFVGCN